MSLFNKLSDHVIETSEQMLRVVEEGMAIMSGNEPGSNDGETASHQTMGGGASSGIGGDPMAEFDGSQTPEDFLQAESPLNGIAEDVLQDIMASQAAPESVRENINGFKAAIRWEEPFILALLAFHAITILFTIFVIKRGGMTSRMILLGIIAIIVRSAEYLNQWGNTNWESFATQDYFDTKGIFVSLMLSGPLLFLSFFMLIAFLREATTLLVQVKKFELKEKHRKTTASKNGNGKGKGKKKSGKKNSAKQD